MDMKEVVESFENTPFVYPTTAEITTIRERIRDKKKQFVFVLKVDWSDGSTSFIWRSYSEFFDLQCLLLNNFPSEAGNKNQPRTLPHLTGREIFKRSDLQLAEKRKPRLSNYVKELLALPNHISQSSYVVSFFHKRRGDPECFNQFPTQLNTRLEFDQIAHEMNDTEENQIHDDENTERFSLDNILNGQINASFDRSMSVGKKPV